MEKILSGKNSAFMALFLVVLLWAAIFLPALGDHELKGEEGRRVLPALDMIKTGQYLVPYIGGEPYFNKPPTINWIIIASVKIFHSTSEFVLRLPSPLSLLAMCLVVLYLPCKQFPTELRFIACVTFLACLGLTTKGRLIEIDTIFVSQTAIACFWWFYRKLDGAGRWSLYFVPMLFLAFATLTKGPAALLVFYCLALSVSAKTSSWRDFFCYQHIICLLIIFAAYFCWHHAVDAAGFAELRNSRMEKELGSRFIFRFEPGRIIKEGGPAIANLMPWLLIIPICWLKPFTDNIPADQKKYFFALRLAFVISFLIINFMPKTLARYSLPTLPLGLFMFAWCIYYNKSLEKSDKIWKSILIAIIALITLAAFAGLFKCGFTLTAILTTVAFVVTAYLIIIKKMFQSDRSDLVFLTAVVVAMGMNLYNSCGCLYSKPENLRKKMAAAVESAVPQNEILHICYPGYQAFIYYLKNDYKYIAPDEILESDADCILIKQEHLEELPHLADWKILDKLHYRESRHFVLIQRP